MFRNWLKSLARTVIGPFWRRLWFRIDQRLAIQDARINAIEHQSARIDAIEHQLARINASSAQFQGYVPSLAGLMAVNKEYAARMDEVSQQVDELVRGLENASREIAMFDAERKELNFKSNNLNGLIDDLDERMNTIRRSLSQNIDDLWQFAKSRTELPTERQTDEAAKRGD